MIDYDRTSYDNDVISYDSDNIKRMLILIKYLSNGGSVRLIITLRIRRINTKLISIIITTPQYFMST